VQLPTAQGVSGVGVGVDVGVGVGVNVAVGVDVAVAVAVGVNVAVAVGVGVGVRVAVAVAVGVGVRVAVAVGVGVGVAVGAGLIASKIAAQFLAPESVADPGPVEPAAVFMAHPAPAVPLPVGNGALLPYNWVREPGDVVENDVIVRFSNDAANIRTAALAVAVVIAVTPEIDVVQCDVHVVYVPGVTSKTELSTPENATIAPTELLAVLPKLKV
jgi:hypothetical protein